MKFPDYPRRGEPLQESWGRQLLDYLRSITPLQSAHCRVSTTSNGTTFDPVIPRRQVGSGAVNGYPYQCTASKNEAGDNVVQIEFGTHNIIIPSIGTEALTANLADNWIDVDETDKVLWFELKLNKTTFEIDAIIIDGGASVPNHNLSADPPVVYQPLCVLTWAEDGENFTVANSVSGSQWFQLCGDSPLFGLV